MIPVIVSILAVIAAVSVAYMLTVMDSIVNQQLYQFGLIFDPNWAYPYWTFLRISLILLGVIAVATSLNVTYLFWKKMRKPKISKMVEEEAKGEVARPVEGVPSLFQCTSCKRSITHPLRMFDFHSERPQMVNICPFCNAKVVPVSYAYTEEGPTQTEEDEEEIKRRINESFSS